MRHVNIVAVCNFPSWADGVKMFYYCSPLVLVLSYNVFVELPVDLTKSVFAPQKFLPHVVGPCRNRHCVVGVAFKMAGDRAVLKDQLTWSMRKSGDD